MSKIENLDVIATLYDIGAIEFGEYQLKSGEITPVYMNLRKIISYPAILRAVAAAMWQKINKLKFDIICGVPYAALPIASCLSLEHDIPMIMRRKERKNYGTKQMIEGVFEPQQNCLIIEDVVTAGASILETAEELKQAGLVVTNVISVVDREQGGRAQLEKHFQFHAVFLISDILNGLMVAKLLKPHEQQAIETFLLKRSA